LDTATHEPAGVFRPKHPPNPEREKEIPRRLFAMARDALLAGFMVVIDQRERGEGWRIVIRDERHCMHLAYAPSSPDRVDRFGPWAHTRAGLWGCCASSKDRIEVRVANIPTWLTEHPEECKGDQGYGALAKHHACHCSTSEDGDRGDSQPSGS
jgi:hypothetical protein